MATLRSGIGDAPKRREDPRFSPGRARYLDDLAFERLAHAVVLRSPTRMPGSNGSTRRGARDARRARGADRRGGASGRVAAARPTVEANPRPANDSRSRRSRCWPTTRCAMSASRWRWSSPRPATRRSMPPNASRSIMRLAGGHRRCGRTRAGAPQIAPKCRAICASTGDGRPGGGRDGVCRAAHIVRFAVDNHRIVTNPMEPRGAVGTLRCGEGPLHAVRVRPEHPRQPRPTARCARRGPRGALSSRPMSAVASARRISPMPSMRCCLWAARRVGRPVKWIATPQRSLSRRPSGARSSCRGGAGAGCGRAISGVAGRQRGRISAPIWRAAPARCRPTSTRICPARSMRSRRSRCTSGRC